MIHDREIGQLKSFTAGLLPFVRRRGIQSEYESVFSVEIGGERDPIDDSKGNSDKTELRQETKVYTNFSVPIVKCYMAACVYFAFNGEGVISADSAKLQDLHFQVGRIMFPVPLLSFLFLERVDERKMDDLIQDFAAQLLFAS